MPKLTKKIVDAANPSDKDYFVWDGDLPGYGLRVFPSGKKSYLVQYRSNGRSRRFTIGLHGPFTPDSARKEAMQILAEIAKGGDPAELKSKPHFETTVSELCDRYLAEGCGHKTQTTIATDKGRIERHIKPLLGDRLVASLSRNDIKLFMKAVETGESKVDTKTGPRGRAIVKGGAGTASRTVGLLGGIISFAVESLKLRSDNPVHGVKRTKDNKRSRFLNSKEFRRLGAALERAQKKQINPNAIAAIRLLLFTGCRKSEILKLKWQHVDLPHRCLRLPESKTGEKIVHLGNAAVDLLEALPQIKGSPYVLPASKGDGHYTGLQKHWTKIREWAELDDVRIHDLRRSFASTAALSGESLLMIGNLLGHSDPKTTQIYAHLADSALQTAANETSNKIAAAMDSEDQ